VKMYVTDHRPDELSERTEVAEIDSVEMGSDGSPIGRVVIFDPSFAEKTRNRALAKKLNTLECSIRARGTTVKGTVNGKPANIVKEFSDVMSVDFVTRAGAGGQALEIQESYKEVEIMPDPKIEDEIIESEEQPITETIVETEPEPEIVQEVVLSADEVATIVKASRLPEIGHARVCAGTYKSVTDVAEAINAEIAYISKLTEAGKPTMLGGNTIGEKPKRMTAEESQEWFTGLLQRHGLNV